MENNLTSVELAALVRRIFEPGDSDKSLAIIVDLPDSYTPDHPKWKARREIASTWVSLLRAETAASGIDRVDLLVYRNVRANNADLPGEGWVTDPPVPPKNADEMVGTRVSFESIFKSYRMLISLTEFSATAPLKIAAVKYGIRGATMAGFNSSMIPALRLDYGIVERKVEEFKALLDEAVTCDIEFDAAGSRHVLHLDLRHRTAHASGGVFRQPGIAGNLPSGEAYIVPYEGERSGDPSRSQGEIPVQFGEDVVVYRIHENKAVEVLSDNDASKGEAQRLRDEPAYGNLAELGLGVLGEFGLEPTGVVLLDEKLGVHVAFGRSEHFGGQVGPDDFSAPDKVVHIDRVYIDALQPKIVIREATLGFDQKPSVLLMRDGVFQVGA